MTLRVPAPVKLSARTQVGDDSSAGPASPAPSGPSRRIALGVAVTLVLSVITFVAGRSIAATADHSNPGNVWLRTVPRGSMTLVDGLNGRVSAQLTLPGMAGHELQVSQEGNTILVYDPSTGILTRINAGTLRSTGSRSTIPGIALVAGPDAAYLVDYGAATVQRIDLTTLATSGNTVRIGGQIGQAGVDAKGTLWVPRLDTGQVIPVGGAGAGTPVTVTPRQSDMSVSIDGGKPVVVDPTAEKVGYLSGTGVSWLATLPQAGASWVVPPTENGSILPLVSTGKSMLDIVDLSHRQVQPVPLGPGAPRQVGPSIADNGRVYVPDYDNGRVLVYNIAVGAWDASFAVGGRPGPFDALSKDGIAYFSNPNGPQTVVVGPSGRPTPLNKYTPPQQQAPRSKVPGTGVGPPPLTGSGPGRGTAQPPAAPVQPPLAPARKPGSGSAAPPAAPQNVQAAAQGAGTANVAWTIPARGGPVSSYTVASQPAGAGQSVSGSATSAAVSGLSCATAYRFTVTAAGPGGHATSGASPAVRPCTTPSAPAGVTAAGQGNGSIQVNWNTVSGAANYQVSYQGPTSGTMQATANSATIPATSLTYLGRYTITVYAMSPAGTSPGASTTAAAGPPGRSFTVDMTLSKTAQNPCTNPNVQQCRAEISHDTAYDGNVAGYAPQGNTVTGYCYKTGQTVRNDNGATSPAWIYTTTFATGYIPSMWLGGPGAYQGLPACP